MNCCRKKISLKRDQCVIQACFLNSHRVANKKSFKLIHLCSKTRYIEDKIHKTTFLQERIPYKLIGMRAVQRGNL